jgi:hypothetical protein
MDNDFVQLKPTRQSSAVSPSMKNANHQADPGKGVAQFFASSRETRHNDWKEVALS